MNEIIAHLLTVTGVNLLNLFRGFNFFLNVHILPKTEISIGIMEVINLISKGVIKM